MRSGAGAGVTFAGTRAGVKQSDTGHLWSLAHGPRGLFLLSRHRKAISAAANQKPFVNKDLCTRKSVKRTIEVVKAKRLASAWQLKMSGSLWRDLEQYSYND